MLFRLRTLIGAWNAPYQASLPACQLNFSRAGLQLQERIFSQRQGTPCRGMIAALAFLNVKAGLAVRYLSGHLLENNVEFHGFAPAPNELDLSWHDERFVMARFCHFLRCLCLLLIHCRCLLQPSLRLVQTGFASEAAGKMPK